MKLFRFLVSMGALLALVAFLPACDSGGGEENPPADTGGGGNEDTTGGEDGGGTPECPAECGACEECSADTNFECVTTCETGQTCNEATNTCEGGGDCDPACGDCETCTDGACVSDCTADQICEDDACVPKPCECDPACGDCETCVVTGDTCACESLCDAGDCETCVAGVCTGCPDGQFCNAADTCEDNPVLECLNPNTAGYCDASIVDELAIAPAPGEGVTGCCCDFTGDGVFDNQISALVAQLGPMLQMSLDDLNATVAESLAGGDFIILFEYFGLAADAADTAYFDVNFFLGADEDDPADPTDNFSGTETFLIVPDSLKPDGTPLITFAGASVAGGVIEAGPSQFIVPISIEDPPLNLVLTVDEASMNADITNGANGYELGNGTLCGYITIEQIFNALNDFMGGSCGCLGYTGEAIYMNADEEWECATFVSTCNPDDPETGSIQEICGQIGQYCGMAAGLLPQFLDVDVDGDGAGDAISLGATFGATSAVLNGEVPAE